MDEQKYASLLRWVLEAPGMRGSLRARLGAGLDSMARDFNGLIGGFIVSADRGAAPRLAIKTSHGTVRILAVEARQTRARSARR